MPVLARMERRGISIDRQVLSRLSGEFAQKQARLEDEINKLAGEPLNPGSPKQLGDILFGKMGLPGGTKTKTGQWATGARALEELAEQGHELPRKILDWRQVSKLRSTYTDALPDYVNPETQPRPHELRARRDHHRPAVVVGAEPAEHPDPHRGRPQDPPRLHRRAGQQARLRRLFADRAAAARRDRRRAGAAEGVPRRPRHSRHDGVGNVRRAGARTCRAKCAAAPRRSTSASSTASRRSASPTSSRIAREEAGAYIKKYFERFPGIRDYMEETKAFAKKNGYVLTLFGRKCHYPDITAANSVAARLQRARRDQRAAAGHRRRHHPPRHGAHRAGA